MALRSKGKHIVIRWDSVLKGERGVGDLGLQPWREARSLGLKGGDCALRLNMVSGSTVSLGLEGECGCDYCER